MKAHDPKKREEKGKENRSSDSVWFKVVLLVCSESVIPAVPNRKGDLV